MIAQAAQQIDVAFDHGTARLQQQAPGGVADHQFERQRLQKEGYTLSPSELFKRQCHLVGWFDSTGLKTRHHIGLDNLLWSTNFPQGTSTWPESRRAIARCFDGVPESERRRVLVDNAARLYKLHN